jgi:DNA-binding IscR family transcriptional regulator
MSRSYLFKILAELKEGGYIKMENGELRRPAGKRNKE